MPTSNTDEFVISDDPSLLDLDVISSFLYRSYWARGIPRPVVEKSVRNSLCFGVYDTTASAPPADRPDRAAHPQRPAQVGFARVITDRATYAYLCDVFILEGYRGRGLGCRLIRDVLAHPDLQGLRRFSLITADAHGLYARFGFAPMADPRCTMERTDPHVYAVQHGGAGLSAN